MNVTTLDEAKARDKEISDEIGEILDKQVALKLGNLKYQPTKEEISGWKIRLETLSSERLENYILLEKLSNGKIKYRKGKGLIIQADSHSKKLNQ